MADRPEATDVISISIKNCFEYLIDRALSNARQGNMEEALKDRDMLVKTFNSTVDDRAHLMSE